jgi:hypothetical protein
MVTRDAVLACFRPVVYGRPNWLAQYMSQGLCRVKWLSAAAILVWVLQAVALVQGAMGYLYRPAAERLSVPLPTLIFGCVAIGIAGAAGILASGRRGITVARARALVQTMALTTVVSESLLFGFSRAAPERIA